MGRRRSQRIRTIIRAVIGIAFLALTSAALPPAVPTPAVRASVEPAPPASRPWAEATAGLLVREEWTRAIFGGFIGSVGLSVADLDGSGDQKIVASARGGGGSYWYVLSDSDGGYRQEWVSPLYVGFEHFLGLSAVRTAELDGAPGAEIVVASGNEVFVHDGATRELLTTVRTAPRAIADLQVADVDGDGEPEAVVCGRDDPSEDSTGLFIYDLATGREELAAEEHRCLRVAVGNVDGDPSPEIVLGSNTQPGLVVDGATHGVEWTYPSGFGRFVRLGDLDKDGMDEIVAGPRSPGLVIYDAELRSPSWEIPLDVRVDELEVADLEGDGRLDIVFGEAALRRIHAWDPRARARKWTITNPTDGVDALAVGDPDGDGDRELLWSAGGISTGPDYLFTADARTRALEWQSQDLQGPFRALDFGDVDDDGRPELLYGSASTDSGYGDGFFFVHDARTKELEYESGPTTGSNWLGIRRIRHADVDADPQAELFVTTSDGYTGILVAYDGITHAEQWRWEAERSEGILSLEPADLDGDGDVELVVGGGGTFGGEGILLVLDGATGLEEWRVTDLPPDVSVRHLRIADLDADPNPEIVVAYGLGQVSSYDGVTHARELHTTVPDLPLPEAVTALETADRNGDGADEILVGTSNGILAVLDPATGAVTETLGRLQEPINALAAVDLTEDGVPDLVLALPEEVVVHDGRFPAERLWASGLIGGDVGSYDSLRVADVDEDGRFEILVNLGHRGLRVYQVDGPGPEVPPGPYLESPALPGYRFKVRITAGGQSLAGELEADCIGETLCVSGALPGRSELFLRPIGPRPNGFLWLNLVRFTPSRVEVWAEQIRSGWINYYDLPALPREDTRLAGLVDKEAFPPEEWAWTAPVLRSVRARPLGAPGVAPGRPAVPSRPVSSAGTGRVFGTRTTPFVADAFPGYRFGIRIVSGGQEQPVRLEADCIPETLCVSGALPGRSELFLRLIGPRPNGFLWTNLVRFTTSRVEVEVEQLATGETRTYVLEEVPRRSDRLPGRVDREAFRE